MLATDFEDIELPVEVTALLHRKRAAIVKVTHVQELPARIVNRNHPPECAPTKLRTDTLDSLASCRHSDFPGRQHGRQAWFT